jgi:hypothetical protein
VCAAAVVVTTTCIVVGWVGFVAPLHSISGPLLLLLVVFYGWCSGGVDVAWGGGRPEGV